MHIEVDGQMTVSETNELTTQMEEKMEQEFDEMAEIKIRMEPHGQ